MTDENPPDPWAARAAILPLAFAQVREDPRLELEIVAALPPGATVVMIASGGDTAAALAGQNLRRLHLVDFNAAQLALSRCKWKLAGEATADQAAALLGHLPQPAEERHRRLAALLRELELPGEILGPPNLVAEFGPDHAGRYEIAFAELQRELQPHRAELGAALAVRESGAAAALVAPGTPLGNALEAAFAKVLALPNLVCLFGPAATRHPRRAFAEHFAWRTRDAFSRLPPATNPFLWQLLAGTFPPGHRYDWLQPSAGRSRPSAIEPVWHRGFT